MNVRLRMCLAALLVVAACSPTPEPSDLPSSSAEPTPSPAAATLTIAGRGTFDCGGGFHGCAAWVVVRPAGWVQPELWSPGLDDAKLPTRGVDAPSWFVSGPATGGPGVIPPGDYWFAVVSTEISDTEPLVLGTDDEPGTGILNTSVLCSLDVAVPPGTTHIDVSATVGPACVIDAMLDPAP